MLKRTFWTRHRFTGITLLLGCLLYIPAIGFMPRDAQGTLLVLLPDRAALLLVAAQPSLTQWSFSWFIGGSIVTPLGLALLTRLLSDAGERTFSQLALIAALFGAVLWVTYLALSLGISVLAAQETARTGVVPGYYVPFKATTQPLFVIYTLLTFAAVLAYGRAVLSTRVLPQWVGWVTIVYTLLNLGAAGFAGGNAAPVVHYLMPLVMGVLLLLRRGQVPSEQKERQRRGSSVTLGLKRDSAS
jgi:hypothetical protein